MKNVVKEIRVGDIIYTRYRTGIVTKITDDKISVDDYEFDLSYIRKTQGTFIEKQLTHIIDVITAEIKNDYNWVIVDLNLNIALSKIKKSEFQKENDNIRYKKHISDIKKIEKLTKCYNKNINFLFRTSKQDEIDNTKKGFLICDDIAKFLEHMNIWMMGDLDARDFTLILSSYFNLYESDNIYLYADTIFIQ